LLTNTNGSHTMYILIFVLGFRSAFRLPSSILILDLAVSPSDSRHGYRHSRLGVGRIAVELVVEAAALAAIAATKNAASEEDDKGNHDTHDSAYLDVTAIARFAAANVLVQVGIITPTVVLAFGQTTATRVHVNVVVKDGHKGTCTNLVVLTRFSQGAAVFGLQDKRVAGANGGRRNNVATFFSGRVQFQTGSLLRKERIGRGRQG